MKRLIKYLEEFDKGYERTGIPITLTPSIRKAIEGWDQSLVDEIISDLKKAFDMDEYGDMLFSVFCIKQCIINQESIFEVEDMNICNGCEFAKEHGFCSHENSHYRKALKKVKGFDFMRLDSFDMDKLEESLN